MAPVHTDNLFCNAGVGGRACLNPWWTGELLEFVCNGCKTIIQDGASGGARTRTSFQGELLDGRITISTGRISGYMSLGKQISPGNLDVAGIQPITLKSSNPDIRPTLLPPMNWNNVTLRKVFGAEKMNLRSL